MILRYGEPVELARANHQIPPAAIANFAVDGAVEEAMLQPIDNDLFEKCEHLVDLRVLASARYWCGLGVIHRVAAPSLLDSGGQREQRTGNAPGKERP